MKYNRANEVLPRKLLEELQQYAQGCYIYIPKQAQRAAWGDKTGARQALRSRNERIRADFTKGMRVETLSSRYYLSVETIKRIVYSRYSV